MLEFYNAKDVKDKNHETIAKSNNTINKKEAINENNKINRNR